MGVALLGAPLLSATAGASTVGLLGVGGTFAPFAGSLFSSLSTLSTVATIGSSLFASMGKQQDYSGQIAANEYNAKINRENAGIAADQTAKSVEQQRRDNYLRIGTATAAAGANNTGFGGSTADILSDTASQNELGILNTKYQGELQKRAYLSDASLDMMSAGVTRKTARLSAGSSLLSGAAKLGGSSIV